MAYLKAAVSRSDLSFTKPGPTFRLFPPVGNCTSPSSMLHCHVGCRMSVDVPFNSDDWGPALEQIWRLLGSVEQVNERVSSSKGHRSALRSLAALAQSKSAISKSSELKKKQQKKGAVDAKDMTRLDLPFCEHLQSRKVFEAKLFYRRCRGQGSNIKDVFFILKVKLNRKKNNGSFCQGLYPVACAPTVMHTHGPCI